MRISKLFTLASVAVLFTSVIVGCDGLGNLFGTPVELPSSISIEVPANMKMKMKMDMKMKMKEVITNTTNWGFAYVYLNEYIDVGTKIANFIDMGLTSISQAKTLLMLNKGKVFKYSGESWIFFNSSKDVNNGFYIYLGDTASKTNLFLEWTVQNSVCSGRAIYYSKSDADTFTKAIVYFEKNDGLPTLDVYMDYKPDYMFKTLRVKLVKLANLQVKAWAKMTFNPTSRVFPSGMTLQAYADSTNGGAIANADGTTNVTAGTISNYIYQEYFDGTGNSTYIMANFDLVNGATKTTNLVDTNQNPPFTNGVKPANIVTLIKAMIPLTNSAYPTVVLP